MDIDALTPAQIIQFNRYIVRASDGVFAVLHEGLLEQSANSIYQTFDGVALYPSVIDKAAQLCYSLCKNHCFQDGNKRTAAISMLAFLDLNDVDATSLSHDKLGDLIYAVAEGTATKSDIYNFLKTNLEIE